ncbi:MAG TPA: protein-glutamate O-methyltransferase CheR [Gemmatimonadaceae bacterium]|nr:protein-glutamate O-methyltransferase CheR [Gemmatimonadaceae bacterium]
MITPDEYQFLQSLLLKQSGLSLGPGKEYLLESRLGPLAATFGFTSITALVLNLRGRPPQATVKAVCDAMTTGETLFFRDSTPFNVFRDSLLPEAAARARQHLRPVRVWSAACSTGQEPYSLAMIADQEAKRLNGIRVEIVATDFSSPTVARAKAGLFNQFEVQRGLPIQFLLKYFTKTEQGYRISPELQARIRFQEHNLLNAFGGFGLFDVIFIRNVLIYFDTATKKDVLERLARQLTPGGCIMLGGTENTLGVTSALARDQRTPAPVYRAPGAVTAAA